MMKDEKITTTSHGLASELNKHSGIYTALYTFLLCVFSLLLIFNYISVFSNHFYLTDFNGNAYVGVVDTDNFQDVKKGQLLKIDKYTSASDIVVGDEVFFSGNAGEGSGIAKKLHITNGYIDVVVGDIEQKVMVSTLIGKVVDKTDNLGYVFWIFQSWVGVVILNIALIVLVIIRTVFGFTIETSAKGRELKNKLYQQKKDHKRFKRIHKNYAKTGLDIESFEALDGDYFQNKQKIMEYAQNGDVAEAYKFLLRKVHRVYIEKQKLTNQDRKNIANCIEHMCLVEKFDIDSEYMLTDLILKTHLVNFDMSNFVISCRQYLTEPHSVEDLECFESVLYILIKRNKNLRKAEILELCENLDVYLCQQSFNEDQSSLYNLCNYIKKLI